jgi:hypothetical protein
MEADGLLPKSVRQEMHPVQYVMISVCTFPLDFLSIHLILSSPVRQVILSGLFLSRTHNKISPEHSEAEANLNNI